MLVVIKGRVLFGRIVTRIRLPEATERTGQLSIGEFPVHGAEGVYTTTTAVTKHSMAVTASTPT